jgi:hypothetical protein
VRDHQRHLALFDLGRQILCNTTAVDPHQPVAVILLDQARHLLGGRTGVSLRVTDDDLDVFTVDTTVVIDLLYGEIVSPLGFFAIERRETGQNVHRS